jgi:alpha-2-macroglobulin
MAKRILPLVLAFTCLSPISAAGEADQALTIVSAKPTGEIANLAQANEIRIIFSEPMVALGRIPQPVLAPFFTITPAVAGTFRWSGTTILIFTPEEHRPLPFATRFDVTIDTRATATSGRRLAKPYTFSFTTPTVRLLSTEWYRKQRRYTDPLIIALRFNQPMKAPQVISHMSLRFRPHPWVRPYLQPDAVARLKAIDPEALQAFDAKVATSAASAAADSTVSAMPAADWDKKRFKPSPDLVVLETTAPVPTESWVALTLDTTITGLEGKETPKAPQQYVIKVDPTFFVTGFRCAFQCDPDRYNPFLLTADVEIERFQKALAVTDVTDPSREKAIAPVKPARTRKRGFQHDVLRMPTLEDAGFDRQPPAHTFAFKIDKLLQAVDGQTLGYTWIGLVENWHATAFTSFGDGHGVWETSGGPKLPFYSRNFQDVKQWVSAVSPDQLMPTIQDLQQPQTHFAKTPPGAGQPRRLATRPDAIQSFGLDLSSVLRPSGAGLVWAAVQEGTPIPRSKPKVTTPPNRVRSTIVQVTNLGITVKDSPQNTLVFVTRLDNGEPVPGAEVEIITLDNKVFWKGTTDEHGIAIAPNTDLRKPPQTGAKRGWFPSQQVFSFIVTARKGDDVAYVGSDWSEGLESWEFGARFDLTESQPVLRGTVFSDRGVYKLGEEVHLKAILRGDAPGGIHLFPPSTPIYVTVRDSQSKVVDTRVVKLSEFSAAEWAFQLPADGSLGGYSVLASLDKPSEPQPGQEPGEDWASWRRRVFGSFLVAAYRRPEFRVDVKLSGEPAIAGTKLKGVVRAQYLFGAPMANRPVRWTYGVSPAFGPPAVVTEHFPDERFAFATREDWEQARQVAADEAALDAKGTLTLDLETGLQAGHPYQYTLEGEVEDVSRQKIAGRASFTVNPAPWYVGVRRPDYFQDPSKGIDTEIIAVTPDGTVAPGVPVTVSLSQVQWHSVRRAEGEGFYVWETKKQETNVGKWTVTTAEKPVPLHIPLKDGGYFILTASAADGQGRSTSTVVSFYAVGPGYTAWARYDHNRIDLVPEKKTYRPGDTARIMIQSPWERATALVTTEREGVRTNRQFNLTSTQQSITVPITEADIPNIYVSVLLVKGRTKTEGTSDGSDPGKPTFRLGYVELQVEDASKRLAVSVKANKEEYRPANAAKVDVEAKDAAGKPSRAEVTLWAVDYGVLSLTGFRTPDVLQSVYVAKALQVTTTDNRQRIVSRRVLTPKGEDEGGGGGAEMGAGTLRKDFRVLAFWLGSVVTDNQGRASVEVKLPESLTTYRIMAVAGDKTSRFGSAESEIRVNKPVLLRAAFPRFLAVGDTAFFGSVVNSQLQKAGTAAVTMKSLDPAVLEIVGDGKQTVTVAAGGSAEVRFTAHAKAIGRARVQMSVGLGDESDAFEDTIAVEVLRSPETVAAYGATTSEASERVAVPAGVVPGFGGLHIELSSTAMVGLGEGARYLVEYPHGCAEQRASRTLALVLAADLGEAFRLPGIDPKDLRTRVQESLKELEQFQCPDGGFSYWAGECWSRSPYLTAYLLHVFQVATSMKFTVDAQMRERAYGYLERVLAQPPPTNEGWWPSYTAWQAFAVKVLVEGGRNQDSNINRLYGYLDRMPVFALAYLYDALVAKGERGPRTAELDRRISNAILAEGGSAHVEESADPYLLWFWNSNIRSTSIALESFVRNADSDTHVRGLVRWLLNARRQGRWGNTQENAWAMEALVAYYRKYEADLPDFSAVVSLGPQQIGRELFKGRSAGARSRDVGMPQLLTRAPAGSELDLKFRREGTGTLFYTARLRYTADELFQQGLDNGFLVERRYSPVSDLGPQPPRTTYQAGELVRVTLTFTLTKERRFVVATDPLPAGLEPIESWFATTAADLAREQAQGEAQGGWVSWWQRGGFDHVERHDDRVVLFATRLSEGRHEFSYVARATTAGTFRTAPAHVEEMYEPEVFGRTATDVIEVKR